jgi:hypothetical protein
MDKLKFKWVSKKEEVYVIKILKGNDTVKQMLSSYEE